MNYNEKIDCVVTMIAGEEEIDEEKLKWKICDRLSVSARTAYELMKVGIERHKRLNIYNGTI